VVIGKIEQDEVGQLELLAGMVLAGVHIRAELIQEFVSPELVGIVGVEIRIQRIVVTAEHRLGRFYEFQ